MIREMLVKELKGQHAGRDMSQDGRDGMSQEEGVSSSGEAVSE